VKVNSEKQTINYQLSAFRFPLISKSRQREPEKQRLLQHQFADFAQRRDKRRRRKRDAARVLRRRHTARRELQPGQKSIFAMSWQPAHTDTYRVQAHNMGATTLSRPVIIRVY
jgi:hypothetical protein